jgi:hypothetical protein
MKQVFNLAGVIALVLPLLGCSRRNNPPPAQQPTPGTQSGSSKETRSYKETVENGLNVARQRYESATKYTPQFAATLVEEYDKLKRADANLGPKKFWEKYGNLKTVVEVEGTIDHIWEVKSPKDHKGTPFINVFVKVRLTGWPASAAPDARPRKAEVQFVSASQKVRSLQKGQSVIVRGSLGGFVPAENSEEQHPSGDANLFLCQLVSPNDE